MKTTIFAATIIIMCVSISAMALPGMETLSTPPLPPNVAPGIYAGLDWEAFDLDLYNNYCGLDAPIPYDGYKYDGAPVVADAAPWTGESYSLQLGPNSNSGLSIVGQGGLAPGYIVEVVFKVTDLSGGYVWLMRKIGGGSNAGFQADIDVEMYLGAPTIGYWSNSTQWTWGPVIALNTWYKLQGQRYFIDPEDPESEEGIRYFLDDVLFWDDQAQSGHVTGVYDLWPAAGGEIGTVMGANGTATMLVDHFGYYSLEDTGTPGDTETYGEVTTTKIDMDYTLSWESEIGKVYRVFWSPEALHPGSDQWQKASGAIIAENTVTDWKDDGDDLGRTDPTEDSVTKRFYMVAQQLSGVYYVATNDIAASDLNPGTDTEPWKTIQKAAYVMVAGDVVLVKEGTYRGSPDRAIDTVVFLSGEGTGPYDMITYAAYPGDTVTIKGSHLLTSWSLDSGSIYRNDDYVSYKRAGGGGPLDYWDLVFVDDQYRLEQVLTKGEMTAGTFYVDQDPSPSGPYDDTLYVWLSDSSNPSGHDIEAAQEPCAFWPTFDGLDYIRIKGFKLRYFSNGPQQGAIQAYSGVNDACRGWIIEDCDLSWANGSGIILMGWDHIVRRNKLNDNGNCGGQSGINDDNNPAPQNLLIEDNEFKRNNWKGYMVEWASGGWKAGWMSYSTFRNNVCVDNTGPGIWIDWGNYEVNIYNNYFDNNMYNCIRLEVAQYIDVWNNIIMNTRVSPNHRHQSGVYIMGDHNQIVHNLFYNNGTGVYVWNAGFPGGLYYTYYGTEDNEVCNNIFLDQSAEAFHFSNADWPLNTIDYNLYDPIGGYKDFWKWMGAGSVSIDEWDYGYAYKYAHSGNYSWMFANYNSSSNITFTTTGTFGIPSGSPYKGECWFYVPTDININGWLLFRLERDATVDITGATPTTITVSCEGSDTTVSRGAWHKITQDRTSPTHLDVYIDSQLLKSKTISAAESRNFTWGNDSASEYGVVYYDDIKIYTGGTVYWEDDCEDMGGANDIIGDSAVVNPGVDFHLTAGSAAIDAGTYYGFAPTDRDGVTRDNPPDIGPYEYVE